LPDSQAPRGTTTLQHLVADSEARRFPQRFRYGHPNSLRKTKTPLSSAQPAWQWPQLTLASTCGSWLANCTPTTKEPRKLGSVHRPTGHQPRSCCWKKTLKFLLDQIVDTPGALAALAPNESRAELRIHVLQRSAFLCSDGVEQCEQVRGRLHGGGVNDGGQRGLFRFGYFNRLIACTR